MSHRHADDDAEQWDRFYTGDDDAPHWSGRPNPTLVAEVSALPAGSALDVGCGEGGDAIWLAGGGWQVTAIDPSGVALVRARRAARAAGVDVTWLAVGLLDLPDGDGYGLVSAHYPVLQRTADDAAIAALLRAVAPGGTLLFVHHDLDPTHAAEHGFDPSAHVMPDTLAARLDGGWDVEVLEARERRRDEPLPEGHEPRDLVLRARRRGA